MNYTEEQMLIKAKKVLQDLQKQYFKEENLLGVSFREKDKVSRPRGEIINTWVAVVDEPIFDASEFLTISDETGEPLYYQNANMIIHEIQKDDKGNYY